MSATFPTDYGSWRIDGHEHLCYRFCDDNGWAFGFPNKRTAKEYLTLFTGTLDAHYFFGKYLIILVILIKDKDCRILGMSPANQAEQIKEEHANTQSRGGGACIANESTIDSSVKLDKF